METCKIQCSDGEVDVEKYVLLKCFGYFRSLAATTMKVKEVPDIQFSSRAFTLLIEEIFYGRLRIGKSDLVITWSDIREIVNCAAFLQTDNMNILVNDLFAKAGGECTESFIDIIKEYKVSEIPDNMKKLLLPEQIAELIADKTYAKQLNKYISTLDIIVVYEIYKNTKCGAGLMYPDIYRVSPLFQISDFIAMYEEVSEYMKSGNYEDFIDNVKVLLRCTHLKDDPAIVGHWKIIKSIKN